MFGKSQMSQSKRKRDDGLHSKRDVLHDEIMQIWEKHPQSPTSYSIYMVPRTLRRLKPRAYTPRIVSIGLIHAKDPHVQPMNVHKESYMCSLFKRTAISEETRDLCVDAMADEAERAGECYHPSVRFDDTIARTMLVDGCFLLELLMRSSRIKHNWRRPYDPIFGDDFKVRDVVHDLLLLENQIPFFILEHLFGHTFERIQNRPNGSLRHLILEFFGNIMNSKFELKIEDGENEKAPDHILGLLHSCYRPDVSDPGDYAIRKYSATELHRSGVNFKPSKRDDYKYLHVDFQTPCLVSRFFCFLNCLFILIKGLFSRLPGPGPGPGPGPESESGSVSGSVYLSVSEPGPGSESESESVSVSVSGSVYLSVSEPGSGSESGSWSEPGSGSESGSWSEPGSGSESGSGSGLLKGLFSRLVAITKTIFKTLCCFSTALKMMLLNKLPVSESEPVPVLRHRSEQGPVCKPEPEPVGKHKCCLFSCLCRLFCRATLEIPQLCINDLTEPFLRNLIAFEQCSQNTPRHITSYAFLMDTLINSEEHVELLEREEVLQNYLGTGEDASDLFNNLCKGVILGEFYFSKQWEQVDHYCKLYWPSCIASLRRTYFSSPWTGISVVAAFILFAFTGIQAICSLISL